MRTGRTFGKDRTPLRSPAGYLLARADASGIREPRGSWEPGGASRELGPAVLVLGRARPQPAPCSPLGPASSAKSPRARAPSSRPGRTCCCWVSDLRCGPGARSHPFAHCLCADSRAPLRPASRLAADSWGDKGSSVLPARTLRSFILPGMWGGSVISSGRDRMNITPEGIPVVWDST